MNPRREIRRRGVATCAVLLGAVAPAQRGTVWMTLDRVLRADPGPIAAAAFAPDGSSLATGDELGDLRMLDLPAGTVRWQVAAGERWIGAIVYSPGGDRIACLGSDLTVHDAMTGRELRRHEGVRSLRVAADGALLVVDRDGMPRRMSWHGGIELREPGDARERQGETGAQPRAMVAGRSGGQPAGPGPTVPGGVATTLRWWPDDREPARELTIAGEVTAFAVRPGHHSVFVAMRDGRQALYLRDGEPMELPAHPSRVWRFAMSPDGLSVAVEGQTWRLWPLDGRSQRPLPGAIDIRAGRHGGELLVRYDQRIAVVDAHADVEVASIPHRSVAFHADYFAAGPGQTVLLWDRLVDPSSGAAIPLQGPWSIGHVVDVAYAGDGGWLAGGESAFREVGCLLLTDPNAAKQTLLDESPVDTVAFSPDGARIYYGIHDALHVPARDCLRVRDAATRELLHEVPGHFTRWRFVDARRVLACVDSKLQVWDAERLELAQPTLVEACDDFQLSADRRTLALATKGEVRVYRVHID